MNKSKKILSLILAGALTASMMSGLPVFAVENAEDVVKGSTAQAERLELAPDANKSPKQLNVHLGSDPATSVNVTYTTAVETGSKIVLNIAGESDTVELTGTPKSGAAGKYFHTLFVTGLNPDSRYEYTVGEGADVFSGSFKTAPLKGSNDSFKFAFLADTQVSGSSDARALGATFNELSKDEELSFVYIAGDLTNTADNESQWEMLFNNGGAFPNGGRDMFSTHAISIVQGNHDNSTMNGHINAPAQEGNIVYSYDYGPATFIMLNLETARSNADSRQKQADFVRKTAQAAKDAGQWVFVGFHKSIYTGASHITDSDVIEARKYWAPIFTECDVDMVLQGHDHVYSRGFVDSKGYNANIAQQDGVMQDPSNIPLYMVGGHAGGLKWYSQKNYTVLQGDILSPNYEFLDKNSTDDQSDVKKEQVIVELEVSDAEIALNTYMFKYDTATDTITTEKYLYDSITLQRGTNDITLGDITNVVGIAGTEFTLPVTTSAIAGCQSVEGVVTLPDGVQVNGVNAGIDADNVRFDWNVSGNILRFALLDVNGNSISVEAGTLLSIDMELTQTFASGSEIRVAFERLTSKTRDKSVDFNVSEAVSTITMVDQQITASAAELYLSDGQDVIPAGKKAVSVVFTGISDTANIFFGDTQLFYNAQRSEKNNQKVYVALMDEGILLETLSQADRYTITKTGIQTLTFGDVDDSNVIDAQDALNTLTAWLRKGEAPSEKKLLAMNVTADGRIDTTDAIAIVDAYILTKEFAVVAK